MQMTWSEKLEAKGRKEGLREGRKEGRQEGRAEAVRSLREVVLDLLGQRFGAVPAKVKGKVEEIDSVDRLSEMAKQVWRVQSLEEMGLS